MEDLGLAQRVIAFKKKNWKQRSAKALDLNLNLFN
jgi:hypothetical protein